MTKTLELENLGFVQMDNLELHHIDGGTYSQGVQIGEAIGKVVAGALALFGAYSLWIA